MSEQLDAMASPEKTSPIPCLPLNSVNTMLSNAPEKHYHRFLMPFKAGLSAERSLDLMLTTARKANAKLILLHVGEEDSLDEEGMFSTFRGLQNHANQILAGVIIDNIKGDTAVSLMEYARNHSIDLIVFPNEPLVS